MDTTRTTTMLLEGLFDSDNHVVWSEFNARYLPLVIAFARRLGLDDQDAADVGQETLVQFLNEYRARKYDRGRGRLRSWMVGIARTRVAGVYRSRARSRETPRGSALVDLEDEAKLTRIWESERRTYLLQEAMKELRERTKVADTTIRAFELLVVRQMPVVAVASELSLSTHDVYLAKSRVVEKLRSILGRLEAALDEEAA